jgi:signal transduction histidine kinase/CheY-like chemotaxis protein
MKKNLQFIIIVLPIMVLLAASSYISYKAWQKYNTNINLKGQLNNAKLLQSFEHSVLNEVVCVATMSQHKELMAKVCNKTKKTTDGFMQQILQQSNDKSLYALEKVLLTMRNTIKDSDVAAVEKLVNGDLDKKMKNFLEAYTSKLKNYSDEISQKEYIRLYGQISDVSYATESEKALVSYYLSLKKPVPVKNLIYWGEIVSLSEIPEVNEEKVFTLYDTLQKIWKDPKLQTALRGIEDIRMDIMTHAATGNYKYDVAAWVSLVNQKQKVLNNVEVLLLDNILEGVDEHIERVSKIFIFGLLSMLLSVFALLAFLLYQRRVNNHNTLFNDLLTKVQSISEDTQNIEVPKDIKSQTLAYEYLTSSYQTLHENEKKTLEENKAKSAFFANIFYEIRTPLDGILGYTKLLKETSLSIEQSDFVSIIENNSENLDMIVNKVANQNKVYAKKLEITNSSFNLVKKIESIVETFAIKADQKDIVLGLFIDPDLPQKVKSDSIRLSQVLTNLISNALESTSAYGSIDLFVEKNYIDEDHVSIKFTVKDSGIGFDEDELVNIFESLTQPNTIRKNISGIDMQNLGISNMIIKRMGGKLEVESKKGEGTIFFFTLNLEKASKIDINTYPDFKGLKVGLALPGVDVNRQVDKNLEAYVKHLGADFRIYYHDVLFSEDNVDLPDLMLVYHNYARLKGELEAFTKLDCNVALITTGTLRSRIDSDKYHFSNVVYSPITMSKTVRILAKNKIDHSNTLPPKSTNNKKFENIHALVVEDNVISQKLIKNDLEKFGLNVMIASNGQEAFEMRRENDFNIVFMDIDMPIMDGVEATRKILYYEGINQFAHVPIIALTVNALEEDHEKYLKVGMDDSITKPFDLNKVESLIQKYCIDLVKEKAATEEDDLIAKVLSGNFLKVEE